MSEWSSDEMRRLQDEAKKRVLEMKARSKFAAEDMNRTMGEQQGAPDVRFIKAPDSPRAIRMPVELPERRRASLGAPAAEKEPCPERKEQRKERKENDPSALIKNVFGDMSDDDLERLFVLSLCLLLSSERTDDEVILALMYILS